MDRTSTRTGPAHWSLSRPSRCRYARYPWSSEAGWRRILNRRLRRRAAMRCHEYRARGCPSARDEPRRRRRPAPTACFGSAAPARSARRLPGRPLAGGRTRRLVFTHQTSVVHPWLGRPWGAPINAAPAGNPRAGRRYPRYRWRCGSASRRSPCWRGARRPSRSRWYGRRESRAFGCRRGCST